MPTLRFAFRTLFKTPFVTSVAILSLSLGIGANSAIFSIFDQILLRPVPVRAPGELVNLAAPGPKPGSTSCNQAGDCQQVFSYPMFRDLERIQQVFTGLAAHRAFGANLAYKGQTTSSDAMLVSGSYFPVLGLQPALGRLLGPDDDRSIGAHFVVVLAHRFWKTRFNSDPGVLEETLIVNGHAMTIVGVAPERFEGTTLGSRPDVFVPIAMRGVMQPGFEGFDDRRNYWAYLFGRLRPGVSIDQASAALNTAYRGFIQDVEVPLQKGMSDATLARFKAKQVLLQPGARGQSAVHREARAPLLLLLGVTTVVLLVACANIANLLLARAATRESEMAVRLSIGGTRRQIVGQLLVESWLLALLGALGGLFVAYWTLQLFVWLLPEDAAATVKTVLDLRIVAFTAGVAILTGVVFGLFPALHSSRPDLVSTLKGQAGQPSGARGAARFRIVLATVQIGLSMALLVSAGLFTKSLYHVSRIDLGIRTDNLVTFGVSPARNGYEPEASRALFERMEETLAAIPGVASVSGSMVGLIAGSNWNNDLRVQGFAAGPDTDTTASFNAVGPGFFRTVGVPLLAGREFRPGDVQNGPKVAIVNEAFTRKFNLGHDVLGKRIGNAGDGNELDIEIVGLVRDAKYSAVKAAIPPQYFIPYRQQEKLGFLEFYVRTSADPQVVFGSIREAVRRLDPNLPIEDLKTMQAQVRENVFLDRLITTLSASFAALATLLAAVGLYGVLAYTIAQRTREIGLRMALGADARRVRGMVMNQVALMLAVGGVAGMLAALGLGRLARSLLFELKEHDPSVLVGATVLLTVIALAAGLVPANRAARIDPMRSLRYE